jgi:hypothetical protein
MRSFMIFLLTHYCASDKIESEMGGASSAYGGRKRRIDFCWENLKEREQWGDPCVDGRIKLRWMFRKWDLRLLTGLSRFKIETGGGHL